MIKAINTHYNGHYFRSRTEARWAVYFDQLGVKWQYENEGYELGDGIRYLPDFYLPQFEMFAEMKGQAYTEDEHKKCVMLAQMTGKRVIELHGLPRVDGFNLIVTSESGGMCELCIDGSTGLCECHKAKVQTHETDAVFILAHENSSYVPVYFGQFYSWMETYESAAASDIARTARFEFSDRIK